MPVERECICLKRVKSNSKKNEIIKRLNRDCDERSGRVNDFTESAL